MLTAMRSAVRISLRGGHGSCNRHQRNFASRHHDDAREADKWEKITYLGIGTCTILAIYNLLKKHPHHDPPPPYSYLHIRNKEFPWGPDGLFEKKHH